MGRGPGPARSLSHSDPSASINRLHASMFTTQPPKRPQKHAVAASVWVSVLASGWLCLGAAGRAQQGNCFGAGLRRAWATSPLPGGPMGMGQGLSPPDARRTPCSPPRWWAAARTQRRDRAAESMVCPCGCTARTGRLGCRERSHYGPRSGPRFADTKGPARFVRVASANVRMPGARGTRGCTASPVPGMANRRAAQGQSPRRCSSEPQIEGGSFRGGGIVQRAKLCISIWSGIPPAFLHCRL